MRSAIPAIAIVACGLGLAFTTRGFAFTPDRPDVEAARREGTVSWYASTPVAQAQQLASRFEQQTGIKV
ncbi:MAG: hypothetical protein ACJ8FP_11435, partial [Xanthobacteraceae bacterium]